MHPQRTKQIHVYFTPAEHAQITALLGARQQSANAFVRAVVLEALGIQPEQSSTGTPNVDFAAVEARALRTKYDALEVDAETLEMELAALQNLDVPEGLKIRNSNRIKIALVKLRAQQQSIEVQLEQKAKEWAAAHPETGESDA